MGTEIPTGDLNVSFYRKPQACVWKGYRKLIDSAKNSHACGLRLYGCELLKSLNT